MICLKVCCLTTYAKTLSSHSTGHKWGPPIAEQQGHIQLASGVWLGKWPSVWSHLKRSTGSVT